MNALNEFIVKEAALTGVAWNGVAKPAAQQRSIKTIWHRATHDACNCGSSLLRGILVEGGKFIDQIRELRQVIDDHFGNSP